MGLHSPAKLVLCIIRSDLLDAMNQAATEYARLVDGIVAARTISNSGFKLLQPQIEEARLLAESARERLRLHRQEHGC